MGMFGNRDIASKTGVSYGANISEGEHELEITKWEGRILRASKHAAITVDFKVLKSDNPKVRKGSVVSALFDFDDEYGYGTADAKSILLSILGFDGYNKAERLADASEKSNKQWNKDFEMSVGTPSPCVGRKVIARGTRQLKKAGKEQLKKDPQLEDDNSWWLKNTFVKVVYETHPDMLEDE